MKGVGFYTCPYCGKDDLSYLDQIGRHLKTHPEALFERCKWDFTGIEKVGPSEPVVPLRKAVEKANNGALDSYF